MSQNLTVIQNGLLVDGRKFNGDRLDILIEGDTILEIKAPCRALLTAERTALNFAWKFKSETVSAVLGKYFEEDTKGCGEEETEVRVAVFSWDR